MAILGFLNYVGGMATFGQVFFALPMTLDLLGECGRNSAETRSSVIPPAVAPLHHAPLHILYLTTAFEEHALRPTHIYTLLHVAYDLIVARLGNSVFLPVPALSRDFPTAS